MNYPGGFVAIRVDLRVWMAQRRCAGHGEREGRMDTEDEEIVRKMRQILNCSVKKSRKGRRCYEEKSRGSGIEN